TRRSRLRLRPHQRPQDVFDAARRRRPGRRTALRQGAPAPVPPEAVDRARGRRLVPLRHRARGSSAGSGGGFDRLDQAAPRELRRAGARLYLSEDARRRGPRRDRARRRARGELPPRAAAGSLRRRLRSHADARVRALGGEAEEAGIERARHLEGAPRRGLPLAHRVLPAHRLVSEEDRAHRDRDQGDPRRLRGGAHPHRRAHRARPRLGPRGADEDAAAAARRGGRRPEAGAALQTDIERARRTRSMSMAPVRLAVAMVRPPQAIVNRGFADLHAEPDEGSERVDQAHYGERFTLLGQEGDWFYAQGADHYFGWMLADVLDEVGPAERRIVGVVAADVRSAPTDAAPVIDRLPV